MKYPLGKQWPLFIAMAVSAGCSTSPTRHTPSPSALSTVPGILSNHNSLRTFAWHLNNPQKFKAEFEQQTRMEESVQKAIELHGNNSFESVQTRSDALREFLGLSSMPSDPASVLFYNDLRGEILFRGTPGECDIVRKSLMRLD